MDYNEKYYQTCRKMRNKLIDESPVKGSIYDKLVACTPEQLYELQFVYEVCLQLFRDHNKKLQKRTNDIARERNEWRRKALNKNPEGKTLSEEFELKATGSTVTTPEDMHKRLKTFAEQYNKDHPPIYNAVQMGQVLAENQKLRRLIGVYATHLMESEGRQFLGERLIGFLKNYQPERYEDLVEIRKIVNEQTTAQEKTETGKTSTHQKSPEDSDERSWC